MGEKWNAYRILVGKPEGKRPLGRPRRRWVNEIVNIPLLPDCISIRKSISRKKCDILPKGPKYLRNVYVPAWPLPGKCYMTHIRGN
jgi:hypothetical protein